MRPLRLPIGRQHGAVGLGSILCWRADETPGSARACPARRSRPGRAADKPPRYRPKARCAADPHKMEPSHWMRCAGRSSSILQIWRHWLNLVLRDPCLCSVRGKEAESENGTCACHARQWTRCTRLRAQPTYRLEIGPLPKHQAQTCHAESVSTSAPVSSLRTFLSRRRLLRLDTKLLKGECLPQFAAFWS